MHCTRHEVDEFALRPFLVCPLCNHTFATRFQLKWLYRMHYWPFRRGYRWLSRRQLWKELLLPPRAARLPYCPVCSRDFKPTWHCLPAE